MGKFMELYNILNLPAEATTADIKKAYRILALKYHPDKNNHSEESKAKFLKVCSAYEILSDNHKRELYDQYGTTDEIAIKQQQQQQQRGFMGESSFFRSTGPMGMSPGDLFSQFFDNVSSMPMPGFGSRKSNMSGWNVSVPSQSSSTSRGPDIRHSLNCTLSALYYGKKTKLGLNRRRICQSCGGLGGMKKRDCKRCQGQGQITETRRMGPMVQTWTQTCPDCGGSGYLMKNSDLCKDCHGECYIKERKIFDVEVKPGMNHGQAILLPGEADEIITTSYGTEKVVPGDVVITINQVTDQKFQRCNKNGCDLVMRHCKIPLLTSLCGGEIYIDGHPNNRLLKISIIPGEIIKPNCFKSVENMGMPRYINQKDSQGNIITEGYGNLYIQFEVDFPDKLEPETVQNLMQVLKNDESVKDQLTSQESTVYDRLDDCIEMEDHVLSDFVPNFNDINSTHKKSKHNSGDKSGNRKRARDSFDSQQDDLEFDSDCSSSNDRDKAEPQDCTIH